LGRWLSGLGRFVGSNQSILDLNADIFGGKKRSPVKEYKRVLIYTDTALMRGWKEAGNIQEVGI
jgi:hypothetical protein